MKNKTTYDFIDINGVSIFYREAHLLAELKS